ATNINAARWSKQFCKWAKDTLAAGLDPVFGAFPQNVYVFDFFAKLTDTTGYMLPQYAASSSDSHPNAAATTLVAPQFVQEIFNHSIAYESIYTGLNLLENEIPLNYVLHQNYPNPFNPSTKITFAIPSWEGYGVSRGVGLVTLKVFDITGKETQTLVQQQLQPGTYEVTFDGSGLNSGVYFYRLTAGDYSETKRMVLIK
ncbi:MAG: T9SS type A sorting domain-containing protein, partial [Ignavibacteria bacterium]|nr:T9SS type A sorting domain-containing protein [Ignavibacteria bacterium]